jgi:hypothetical protein
MWSSSLSTAGCLLGLSKVKSCLHLTIFSINRQRRIVTAIEVMSRPRDATVHMERKSWWTETLLYGDMCRAAKAPYSNGKARTFKRDLENVGRRNHHVLRRRSTVTLFECVFRYLEIITFYSPKFCSPNRDILHNRRSQYYKKRPSMW